VNLPFIESLKLRIVSGLRLKILILTGRATHRRMIRVLFGVNLSPSNEFLRTQN